MNIKSKVELITKLSLEKYPSKPEIMNLLDLFLYDNNYRKDYHLFVEKNVLHILFHQSETADEFIKHLRKQKMSNSLYSKLKITISFNPFPDYSSKSTKTKRSSLTFLKQHKCTLKKNDSCPLLPAKRGPFLKKRSSYKSILSSEAFIDNYEKEKEEKRKNRYQWIDQKDFYGCVGKASINKSGFIDNYVVREPSIPANRFQFNLRASKKYQWLEDQGFL